MRYNNKKDNPKAKKKNMPAPSILRVFASDVNSTNLKLITYNIEKQSRGSV